MQSSMGDRPSVPFGLSLAGLLISGVAAVIIGMAWSGMFGTFGSGGYYGMMGGYYGGTGMMGGAYAPWGMYGWGGYTWIWIPLIVASIGLAAFGAFMMNSSQLGNVRMGSALVLVAAVLAFPTMFGFVVGSMLLLLGGILGLVWTPTKQTRP